MLAVYMIGYAVILIAGMAIEEYMPGTFGKETKIIVKKEDK